MKRNFLAIAFLFGSCLYVKARDKGMELIKTNAGLVSGGMNKDNDVHIFKGIPFAAPPVGVLRWKAPQPVQPWTGTKKCEAFGASPVQNKPVPFGPWTEEYLIPKEPVSEDCLYLNVWTKAKTAKEKRPVIVWIYGGGFTSGGSGCAIYDGEAMAKKGVVFVSINYRVGVFGFFAHPELTKESGNNASDNYGLMDQIAALKWVQTNIAAFGGDADNVTIAGQSAGSMSVNCLVASPLAKGLFIKAIAESGANFVSGPFGSRTLKQAEEQGLKTALSLHASSLSALRSISAEELLQKAQGTGPVTDGYVLPDAIANIFANGNENRVTLLTGWNEDEGLLFGRLKTAEEFREQISQDYGAKAETFLKFYPAISDAEAVAAQLSLSRDMTFGVQNYTWANVQSSKGASKVFVYRFTRKLPAIGEYVKYGAFHTGEVVYAYDNLKFVNRAWLPVDRELATIMSSYWANFAATGNPNGAGLPEWRAYDATNNSVMFLGEKSESKTLPDKAALDFLYSTISGK